MLAIVFLAAGGGTRMKSSLPKVLHQICGKPMISMVLGTAKKLFPDELVVVLGHEKNQVVPYIDKSIDVVEQDKLLGTAHAVAQAAPKLKNFTGDVLVLYGDTPLIKKGTLQKLIAKRKEENSAVVLATTELENPYGYGRVVRDQSGNIEKIVEENDASDKERQIKEVNTGIYCFDSSALLSSLDKVLADNSQNEYYLTDIIGYLVHSGSKVTAVKIDSGEALGVNSRKELAQVNDICRRRINDSLMKAGVTIFDPASTFIDADVEIESDCLILPNTIIKGKAKIMAGAKIGPNCFIEDSEISQGSIVRASYLYDCKIGKNAQIGPFSHLRPGTVVEEGGKVGAFSEIKKSTIGKKSKVPHLSYIGDTKIGKDVNIGAGTITCNYDGKKKHQTVIEDGAFIGSNTSLVAPIKIGKNAYTAASSALTKDVPDDSLAVERSEQEISKDWVKKKTRKK